MSTDQQQSMDEQKPESNTDDVAADHRQSQESGEVFEGGPYSER